MKLRQYIKENRDMIDSYIELDSGDYDDLTLEQMDDIREEFIYNDDNLRDIALDEGVDI